jgi:hypothetical protein
MAAAATLLGALLPSGAWAILGGDHAPKFAPNLVMILSDTGSLCSGVVIAPDAVLTAAHCVSGARSFRLHWRDPQGRPVLVEPAAIVLHPQFNPDAVKARIVSVDLAVVRTRGPIPPQFHPIALPDATTPIPDSGTHLTVAGFGLTLEWDPSSTGDLQATRLPVVTPHGQGKILIWLADSGGRGACLGDSGGLIADAQGRAVAITAWSEGAASRRCGALTQGVLIAPHRDWITQVLKR